MSLVLASVGQFWKRAMGFMVDRWRRNPQSFSSDIFTVLLVALSSLKHIPISDKLRLVFHPERIGIRIEFFNYGEAIIEREAARVDPHIPETMRLRRLLVKLVQALSHGFRLQHDSRVTISYVNYEKVLTGRFEVEVVAAAPLPRYYGKKEISQGGGCVDTLLGKVWDMKSCDIEHLEGLNLDLMVVESEEPKIFYGGHGKIVIHTEALNGRTEVKLVAFLAHEVGHGVAMHHEGSLFLALLALTDIIPRTSVFWYCTMFVRLCDLALYSNRRMELEAHYIGLMLTASAGYDPRPVLHLFQKVFDDDDIYYLDTTHPSTGRIVEMLSKDIVMDRALKIYEQVQAGHEIPSFVEQRKIVPCSPIFSPFSVKQLFFPHVDGSLKLSK